MAPCVGGAERGSTPRRGGLQPRCPQPLKPWGGVMGDVGCWSQVSSPLPRLPSQAQLPEAPARPVVWGQVTAARLPWGAGPVPQMIIHRSHAPWVSHQLPEGTPGTSCSPRTLRGAAHSHRTGPSPAAPSSGTLWSQVGLIGGVPRAGGGRRGETLWAGVTQGTGSCGNAAPSARGSDFGPFSGPHGQAGRSP